MDQSLNLLIGFGAGTVASILAWWLVLNYFTPRLQVSDLNPLPQPLDRYPCGYRYRVKVRNVSRRHSVANLQLHARLVVKGLDQERPTVRSSMLLPVGANAFPVLESRRGRQSGSPRLRVG